MAFTEDDLRQLKGFLSAEEFYNAEGGHLRPLIRALITRLEAAEELIDYAEHMPECKAVYGWEAGEPTAEGGYRVKYCGIWYQRQPVDETPKCSCGFNKTWTKWRKSKGE